MPAPAGDHAPIAPDLLTDSLRSAVTQRMLPGAAYADPAVFAWEIEHLFRRGWVCVGRSRDVAERRGQRAVVLPTAVRAGGPAPNPGPPSPTAPSPTPPSGPPACGPPRDGSATVGTVLLVRDVDGTLRGFDNVCRHRGHELLGAGAATTRRAVVCPYHAWSYGLDGQLIAAPGFPAGALDPAEFGLVEIGVAEWQGWIFADASGSAGPFSAVLGNLDELVDRYQPADLVPLAAHEYRVEANWKIIIENYNECYHCSLIHPELCRVSPPNSGATYPSVGGWTGGWLDLAPDAVTMSLDGQPSGAGLTRLPRLADGDARRVAYVTLAPNVLISLHPDYVMTHRLTPLTPGATQVECTWAFHPEAAARPGFDPAYAVDFWDLTNRQDWTACESVQRGVSSPHYRPGPLAPDENEVGEFVDMIARAYRGEPPRVPARGPDEKAGDVRCG
ncbi:MAG: aromatic ring-hydroxylating oxygenase subunit alpha [Frankia sp.]